MNTLFGGLKISVQLEPQAEGGEVQVEDVKVRQVLVREYEDGFRFYNDEVALVGFLVGKDKNWAFRVLPESYEEILSVGKEVNAKGFFTFCQRRMVVLGQQEIDALTKIAQLPDDVRKLVLEQGTKINSQSSSDTSSIPRPRRV